MRYIRLPMRRIISSPTALWWTGCVLVAAYALVAAGTLWFPALACPGVDCGDARRGAFFFTFISSPLAVTGLAMATWGASAGCPRGAPLPLQRIVLIIGRGALITWGVVMALVAASVLLSSARELVTGLTGRGLIGPLDDLEDARGAALHSAAVRLLAGIVCASLSALALFVARKARRSR